MLIGGGGSSSGASTDNTGNDKTDKTNLQPQGEIVKPKRVWGKDKMGDLTEVEARMWGLEPGWEKTTVMTHIYI